MTIFDQESHARAEADSDLTREFWGDNVGWVGRHQSRTTPFQVQRPDDTPSSFSLDHKPASMRAIRDGLAAFRPMRRNDSTGPVERTREHGIVTDATVLTTAPSARAVAKRPSPGELPHRDATIGDLAAGRFDATANLQPNEPPALRGDARVRPPVPDGDRADRQLVGTVGDAATDVEFDLVGLTSRRQPSTGLFGTVDPTVVRVTLVLLAVIFAIPLALALRSDSEPVVETDPSAIVPPVDANGAAFDEPDIPPTQTPSAVPDPKPSGDSAAAPESGADGADAAANASADDANAPQPRITQVEDDASTVALATTPTTEADAAALAGTDSNDSPAAGAASSPEAATVTEDADREMPDCSRTYSAGPGDSWYRIADEAGVTPSALLVQNRATLDTVIFPGTEICLPAGAAMPSAPTTAAPTTAAPTTAAPTTAAPTTAAPTTAAPTTTAAAPPASSRAEVQALIREIWPDELEERALEIARRESNFHATADNGWCCVGVFQLYWTAHRNWLDDYGITTREGLKDARKNITAAYGLYQSSGGWGPWGG